MDRPYTVLHGRDNEVIPILLKVHCAVDEPLILDCTYNKGRMWKGLEYKPVRMDIDPSYDVDIVGDFKQMPFQDASFDVIVFDPPHRPVSAGNNSAYSKYNEGVADEHRVGDISDLFPPFLSEAKRILKPGGIVLAKLADLVHNHRYSWIQVDFINAVRESGMTPCDMMIKIDPCAGNLKSGHWKNVNHLRKKHCYWIVVRNSKKCECK